MKRKRRIISTTTVQPELKNDEKIYIGNKIHPRLTPTQKTIIKKNQKGCGCGKVKRKTAI